MFVCVCVKGRLRHDAYECASGESVGELGFVLRHGGSAARARWSVSEARWKLKHWSVGPTSPPCTRELTVHICSC